MIIKAMKKINLETKITLYSNTMLSDYNVFLIQELYMPIVGSDGVSLYCSLSNKFRMNKRTLTFADFTSYLCVSLNDLLNAKKKLEAVGLISSHAKKDAEEKEVSIILYSPKSPRKFFDDIVLKGLLKQRIGTKNAAELKDFFKMERLDNSNFVDESASFSDVFSVDFDGKDFKYEPENNEFLMEFVSKPSTLKFDFEHFFKNLFDRCGVSKEAFTIDEKNTISSLANLYGYNEEVMIDLVIDCYNTVEKRLQTEKLKKICFNQQVITKQVIKKTSKSMADSSSNNPLALKVKIMDKYTPFQYLKLKQNNIAPVQSDMNILTTLATRLGLTNGVINALVDYVLETNNNILSKNLVEKIGASLVRAGFDNAYDAMNYLANFKKKTEKNPGTAEILSEKPTSQADQNNDVWAELEELD